MSRVLCVILNWRTPEMTLRAARSALAAMEGIEGAITIVDNDSGDGSFETMRAAAAEWPRVQVLQSGRNGGFGAGNNFGIRAGLPDGSQPDFIYVLNSDAFPAEDAIKQLLGHLIAHPEVGFAGSYIHGEDGGPHTTAFRFPSIASEFEGAAKTGPISRLLKHAIVAPALPEETTRVGWMAGASVLMRREVLDEIGLFDERFFLYFEETDLCLRATRAGWAMDYVVESRVMHIGSVSTGMRDWARVPDYWFASRRYYFEKNHGRIYAGMATLAHLAGLGIYGLRVILQRKKPHTPPYFARDLMRHSWRSRMSQES
ncbi:glycosyltransferase family 2 protein [Pararhodobacter oceanensis]|uniref:Glycosyl transferase n=1 Tax=Pararhodobacter oceanensis TaxID=2172121 RepID=A0A2T8HSR1_9RHOB|nr:glycosyltransferase family 2 protein [Pararhodobacter oceanensis]PVH28342.1 glycosyl transferase [Pararhodobacter oceanensis]